MVHRTGIKHQALYALSRLKTEGSAKTKSYEELLELMMEETEEQQDVKTE